MIAAVDAAGAPVLLPRPAQRIVSLIPSITETLFALGAGARVVGCTSFCLYPSDAVKAVRRIGGTKDPQIDAIRALAPDLILANREENRREDVEVLRDLAPTHVSYPRDIPELVHYIAEIGRFLALEGAALALCDRLLAAVEEFALTRPAPAVPVLYVIWRKPWMAAAGDTFIDAMLTETGFRNVLHAAPGRYPAVDLATARQLGAERVLLSSEPFPFDASHRDEVAALTGLPREDVVCVSGEAFSWFGCRTITVFDEARRVHLAGG